MGNPHIGLAVALDITPDWWVGADSARLGLALGIVLASGVKVLGVDATRTSLVVRLEPQTEDVALFNLADLRDQLVVVLGLVPHLQNVLGVTTGSLRDGLAHVVRQHGVNVASLPLQAPTLADMKAVADALLAKEREQARLRAMAPPVVFAKDFSHQVVIRQELGVPGQPPSFAPTFEERLAAELGLHTDPRTRKW